MAPLRSGSKIDVSDSGAAEGPRLARTSLDPTARLRPSTAMPTRKAKIFRSEDISGVPINNSPPWPESAGIIAQERSALHNFRPHGFVPLASSDWRQHPIHPAKRLRMLTKEPLNCCRLHMSHPAVPE